MDSRELYKAAEHLGTILTWEREWIHFGTGEQVDTKLIDGLIKDFLQGNLVNLVNERTNSGTFELSEIQPKIKELLGRSNFELWNESMDRAIQFNRIGVLLKGQKTPYNIR